MTSRKTSFLSKIKSPTSLKRTLGLKKGKTVFTNGCFDILHKGHVTYLERAKRLGDFLIVALNSDPSIQKIKGPTRPINPLQDRLEVMAALESVDFVTWFEEETPLHLIRLLKPKVLVKGGDWRVDQIVGAPDVIAGGGKVCSLPYIEGRSTTQIIARAREKK
jgi:rfaE bifunctional protein nucleotidyltransferase chain/domain